MEPTHHQRHLRRPIIWLLRTMAAILVLIIVLAAYLLATGAYARDSLVQPAFTTSYVDDQVKVTTRYQPHFYSGALATAIGIYGRGTIDTVWDRIQSPKLPPGDVQSIVSNIYALRFDPTKAYLISGDQFDALYLRNLGIFYQDLLNPVTRTTATDWHNRERIAVQSEAYALAALNALHRPVTTLMTISQRGVLAFNLWRGSYPSDTMFSVFQELITLQADPATAPAAHQLQATYDQGLGAAYQNYLATVRDPRTGLVRANVHLASARDSARRQSSFYDNVILWKTEQLATQLGYDHVSAGQLAALRQAILARYWDDSQGHFIDDLATGHQHSYSSDWLIALPVGFLDPADSNDLAKLERLSSYIDTQHLADPLPIRYTTAANTTPQSFFVRHFAGDYGTTAIWSYWGTLYITLETDLYNQTHQSAYAHHVESSITGWQAVMVRDRGYPETLNAQGKMYETLVYESIRRTGWVVDFEAAKYNWDHRPQ